MKKKKRLLYLFLSLVISLVLIYLLLSQISTADLKNTLQQLYFPSLFLYMLVALSGAFFRAWRFRLLLRPEKIGWGSIILVTFVKNSLVDLLPARIGSLSYIYLLNSRLGFPFEIVTSSFIASFLLDFLTLSPFLLLAILAVGLGTDAVASPLVLFIALAFFLLIIALFAWIVPLAWLGYKVYSWVARIFGLEKRVWLVHSKEKFLKTIEVLSSARHHQASWLILLLSLLLRLAKYGSLFFLLHSLLFSHGYELYELSFWRLILGVSGAELTSALPIKGIAGFGTWESAWALTFRLMGTDPKLAIISGLGVHFLTNLFEYSLGISSLFILAHPFFRRQGKIRRKT